MSRVLGGGLHGLAHAHARWQAQARPLAGDDAEPFAALENIIHDVIANRTEVAARAARNEDCGEP